MSYLYASYEDVRLAIDEDRLKINAELGTVCHKLPYPKAIWRANKLESVSSKGREHLQPYYRVSFSTSKGRFRGLIHRVIWFAAMGPIPKGLFINHKDGDKANNGLSNLELVTQSQNIQHAIRIGLFNPYAPKNWKLTADQVRHIRKAVAEGERQSAMSLRFGVSANVICRIIKGHTYRSVK